MIRHRNVIRTGYPKVIRTPDRNVIRTEYPNVTRTPYPNAIRTPGSNAIRTPGLWITKIFHDESYLSRTQVAALLEGHRQLFKG